MTQLKFTIALAMTAALGPFAFDTYLPAFPDIARSMHTTIDNVSVSVSLYLFGLAFGQLIGGPLSDRLGRAKIMLIGLALFSLASFLLAFSHSLTELLFWRALQAFGGGWASVSVPAIVRDRTEGKETAKLFGLISLMMMIAPALAPSIGSLILAVAKWQIIFVFLTAYSLVTVFLLKLYVFSIPSPLNIPLPKINFFTAYAEVLKNNLAIYFILLQAFAFSIMMIFITHASFIYQAWFGVSTSTFALLFACNIAMMSTLNILSRVLLRWFEPVQILYMAVALQTTAVIALLLTVLIHPNLNFFVPAIMLAVGSLGVISPNNQACYLQFFKEKSATAAALMGALQLSIAGCLSIFSAFISNNTLYPIIWTMVACAFLCSVLMCRIAILLPKIVK